MENSEKITATLLTTKVIGCTKESGIYDVEEIVFKTPRFNHAIKRIKINHSGVFGEDLIGKTVTVSLWKNVIPQINGVVELVKDLDVIISNFDRTVKQEIIDYPSKISSSGIYGDTGTGKSFIPKNEATYNFFDEKVIESIINDGKSSIVKVDEFLSEKPIGVKFGEYLAKNYFCAYYKDGKFYHPNRGYVSVSVLFDEFLIELKSGNLDEVESISKPKIERIKTHNTYVDKTTYYEHNKPENKERTNERLSQIFNLGLTEVGLGQFGIDGLMSGLYIERVWSYNEKDWGDYINWIVSMKEK